MLVVCENSNCYMLHTIENGFVVHCSPMKDLEKKKPYRGEDLEASLLARISRLCE